MSSPTARIISRLALAFAALSTARAADIPSARADTIEDAAARAALPEFQYLPAAKPTDLAPAAPLDLAPFSGWSRSQGDNGSRRYSTLAQITRANIKDLAVAWTFRAGDGTANIQCTPIIVDGFLYAPTPGKSLVALDAATGRELWRRPLIDAPTKNQNANRLQDVPARRGLLYWTGDTENPARLLVGAGDWLYALNPKTGASLDTFGTAGRVSIPTGTTATGVVFKNVFITSGLTGDIFGFDVRTGKALWRFHSIARGEEFGADTWDSPRAGANGWSGLSLDDQRGIAFIALGAPRPDMVGVDRIGNNLFSNCVLALDALTGKRLWHFQDVRHDIWDLDVCAPPNLVTITREGRRIDVVTSLSKSGHLFVLDRVTGQPVFPVRLRRAPTSTLPGERTAPYQPDPELPEPISSMAFDPANITDLSPAARDFVQKQVDRASYGFFQPFVEGRPLLFTGSRGGAEWSGAAVDVPTGRLYVTSNRLVSKVTVIANDEKERDPKFPPSAGENIYAARCAACHGPTRQGLGMVPPLLGLKVRLSEAAIREILAQGRGAMLPNLVPDPTEQAALIDFLLRRNQPPTRNGGGSGPGDNPRYIFDGFGFLNDPDGNPGIKPPWGLLNCYDLNTGKILWRSPLGEIPALAAAGVPKTGAQNLGGASVTAGGLVFVAGTADEKFRAFDANTGEEIWSYKLPFAGTAAPAIYEVAGRQYIVITATGGGKVGGPTGDATVAFALPPKP